MNHQLSHGDPSSCRCFGHRPHAVADEKHMVLLGPNLDGYYLYGSGGNRAPDLGSSLAFTPIRLHPGAAFSLSAAADYIYNTTGEVLKFAGGYRTEENQRLAFKRALIKSGDFMATIRRVAPPGFSEHHTGLAVDLASHWDEAGIVLPFFGWELSFPRANAQGIRYEPWHWRFVGLSAIASSLANAGLKTPPSLVNAGLTNLNRIGIYDFKHIFNDPGEKPTPLSFAEDAASLRFMLNEVRMEDGSSNDGDDESDLINGIFSAIKDMGVSRIPNLSAAKISLSILSTLVPGEHSRRVARLQRNLKQWHLFQPGITAQYGNVTLKSVACYQKIANLPPTGVADWRTLKHLSEHTTNVFSLLSPEQLEHVAGGKWLGRIPTSSITRLVNGKYATSAGPGDIVVASCTRGGWSAIDKAEDFYKKNCTALMVDQDDIPPNVELPVIKVAGTRRSIGLLAKFARAKMPGKFIAVTGSAGKTTTKALIRHILSNQGLASGPTGSANSLLAICYHLINAPLLTDYHVFESGLGATGSSILDHSRIIQPDVAVITSVHAAHAEGYKSLEEIAQRKLDICDYLQKEGWLLVDRDSPLFPMMHCEAKNRGVSHILTFGIHPQSDVRIIDCQLADGMTRATVAGLGGYWRFSVRLPGVHWAKMVGAALASCRLVGGDVKQALNDLDTFTAPSGRGSVSSIVFRKGEILIFDGSYNANPGSMRADLSAYESLARTGRRRKVGVIGAMKELGAFTESEHQTLAPVIDAMGFSSLFLIGQETSAIKDRLPMNDSIVFYADIRDAIDAIEAALEPEDFLFIKGSHSIRLNELINHLTGSAK